MTTSIEINNNTRQYLELMQMMLEQTHPGVESWYSFILKHGQEFPFTGNPSDFDLPKGEMKECYANAGRIAIMDDRFIYVEGFATSMIPTGHAWLLDTLSGLILDTTWDDGQSYFGIPIKTSYLRRHCVEMKYWGMYDGITRPRIMDHPEHTWKYEINSPSLGVQQ